MTDLIAFLRARLDEDEAAAQAAFSGQADPENGWSESRTPGFAGVGIIPHVGHIHEDVQAVHVVKWNPARVLREVEAKRRIVDDVEAYRIDRRRAMNGWLSKREEAPNIARFLALPYSDHPDYDDEAWQPYHDETWRP